MNVDMLANVAMQISTGLKINSAADDASGLAITENITAQIDGMKQGERNTGDMSDLVGTADAGLSNISDSLQQVRQLSLQAANGTLGDDDKKIIQNQISQIMQGIGDTASGTQYNNMNLLDGSFTNKNVASGADGKGSTISIGGFSVKDLGLKDYNVTGSFDISDIDKAIGKVSAQRSLLGAKQNTMAYTMNADSINSINLAASRSRMMDTNIPKAVTDFNKAQMQQTYQVYMQKKAMNQEQSALGVLGQ